MALRPSRKAFSWPVCMTRIRNMLRPLIWNIQPSTRNLSSQKEDAGLCTKAFPLYSTSRIVAGGDIKGDVFKCHLIPVEEAIARSFYEPVAIDGPTRAVLEQIFPDGVCDYSQGDMGRPADL